MIFNIPQILNSMGNFSKWELQNIDHEGRKRNSVISTFWLYHILWHKCHFQHYLLSDHIILSIFETIFIQLYILCMSLTLDFVSIMLYYDHVFDVPTNLWVLHAYMKTIFRLVTRLNNAEVIKTKMMTHKIRARNHITWSTYRLYLWYYAL